MLCSKCKVEMGQTKADHQYRECGLDYVWLKGWDAYVCPNCNIRLVVLPSAEWLTSMIAHALVRNEARLDGDAIVFLRKALRLTSEALAHIVGVNRVEVSRWENNKNTIGPLQDFRLRLEVIDRLIPLGKQRESRELVTLIFQRAYKDEIAVSDTQISVPDDELAVAV
jgi:transcriptional regulator with XRE-family HTH domain